MTCPDLATYVHVSIICKFRFGGREGGISIDSISKEKRLKTHMDRMPNSKASGG
jgi:hypothetical protein